MHDSILARGMGVSHGSASGTVATSTAQAEWFWENRVPYILVLPYTEPEHVTWIARSMGVVVAGGGPLCHAAITARTWRKPCVCSLPTLEFIDGDAHINGCEARFISIDGKNGEVFLPQNRE